MPVTVLDSLGNSVNAPNRALPNSCVLLENTNVSEGDHPVWNGARSHDSETYAALRGTLEKLGACTGVNVDFLCGSYSCVPVRLGVDASRKALASNPSVEFGLVWSLNDVGRECPIPSGTYDQALCISGMAYLKDIDFAVSEMYRVVKPGGRLIIAFDRHLSRSEAQPAWLCMGHADRVEVVSAVLTRISRSSPVKQDVHMRRYVRAGCFDEWPFTFLHVDKVAGSERD
jgi:SAM-dependent methyltransferase